jgi:hypothetical protein
MSIKETDLKKLKPLDRLELLLRLQTIGSFPMYTTTIFYLYLSIGFIGWLVLVNLNLMQMNLHTLSLHSLYPFIMFGLIFTLLTDFLLAILYVRRKNLILKEFFQINISATKK